MSQYLKKYRLLPPYDKKTEIMVAANPATGDGLFHEPVAKMTDRKAELLINRKDGRGQQIVEAIKASTNSKPADTSKGK